MPPKRKKDIKIKENGKNNSPLKSKRKYPVFEFDMKKILKERQADVEYWKKSAELDAKMKIVDDLYTETENKMRPSVIPNFGYIIFDRTKYNSFYKKNPELYTTKSHLQQLLKLSIEPNELEANILFNNLKKANWSPVLDEIKNIFNNWGADLDTLINTPLLKCQIYDNEEIGLHNFELIFTYIVHSILKKNNGFNNNDLLTLAKFTFTISLDHYYKKMMIVIKKLFCTCVEAALDADNESAIFAFARELYAKYSMDDLLTLVVNLFLPLEGHTMEKIYTYLTYKLFNELLDKSNNTDSYPSSMKDWFIHDLVDEVYFRKKPETVFNNILHLMEHVVFIFGLWEEEEGLKQIYEFLNKFSGAHWHYILDSWKMQLFRLHMKTVKIEFENSCQEIRRSQRIRIPARKFLT